MSSKASSHVLTDHDEIQRWAEERGAKPAAVQGTGDESDIGMIRLDFPGYSGEDSLQEISWNEWFDKFDESNLALVVQEKTANGSASNFNKLVSRNSVEEYSKPRSRRTSESGRSARRGTATRSSSARVSPKRTSASSKKKTASARTSSSSSGGTKRASGRASARSSKSAQQKKSGRRAA